MSRKIHIAALKSVGFPALLGYNIYLKGKKGEVMKHKGGCLVWGLFILFILGAIGFIAGGEIISGILCGVIAAMCCPFIDIKKWIRIAGTIALILAMGALMPDSVGDTVPEAVEATEESTASTEAVATEAADVQPETEAEPEKSEGPMVEDAAEPTTAVAPGPDSTGLDITVLDVGQALSVLIECDGEYIIYCRTKTKDRRNDQAKMIVRVHPLIRPLVEKYRGKERVFNFSERFSTMGDLNRSINIGLKEIGI